MTKKQFYIPGKKYEWTKEAQGAVNSALGLDGGYMPRPCLSTDDNLFLFWVFTPSDGWTFFASEEGVEIPEYLVKFYGEEEE